MPNVKAAALEINCINFKHAFTDYKTLLLTLYSPKKYIKLLYYTYRIKRWHQGSI